MNQILDEGLGKTDRVNTNSQQLDGIITGRCHDSTPNNFTTFGPSQEDEKGEAMQHFSLVPFPLSFTGHWTRNSKQPIRRSMKTWLICQFRGFDVDRLRDGREEAFVALGCWWSFVNCCHCRPSSSSKRTRIHRWIAVNWLIESLFICIRKLNRITLWVSSFNPIDLGANHYLFLTLAGCSGLMADWLLLSWTGHLTPVKTEDIQDDYSVLFGVDSVKFANQNLDEMHNSRGSLRQTRDIWMQIAVQGLWR